MNIFGNIFKYCLANKLGIIQKMFKNFKGFHEI